MGGTSGIGAMGGSVGCGCGVTTRLGTAGAPGGAGFERSAGGLHAAKRGEDVAGCGEGAAIRVLVRPLGRGGVPLRMGPGQTVLQAKARVELATGMPAEEQRLLAAGKELRDDDRFEECGLRNGSTIQLVRRLRGGSAAARAQMAMKKKKERQAMMDAMKEDESSSDEEAWQIDERPACVEDMNFDVKALMTKQFDEFSKHLSDAIENPGENQEKLEGLESTFDKLLYRGFIQNKGFYPVHYDYAASVEKAAGGGNAAASIPLEDPEGETLNVDGMPVWQRVPYQITHNAWFKNFIVFAIVVAGVIVGTNTYLNCDDQKSCYADVYGATMHGNRTGAGPCQNAPVRAGPDECLEAKCCYEEPASAGGVSYCWERGPMPECYFEGSEQTIEDVSAVLDTIDLIILYIFTFECVMSIVSNGTKPWKYFQTAWNSFDFFIVVMCYLPDSVTGGNVAVLRLLRLMRLLKLLHTIDNLQVILLGLGAGFGSIGYIMILMTLVYYLFAIMAIMLYGQNDTPEFKNLDTAMITLFRVSTMEDWTDVMYINMLGCASYGFGSYCYDDRYCDYEEEMCKPADSHASGYWAALFFSVFVIISGYVVMSLFIGVIAASMQEETDKQVASKKAAKQKIAKYKAKKELADRRTNGIVVRPSEDLLHHDHQERQPHENPNIEKYLTMCDQCERLVDAPWFGWFITTCILIAAVVIGWQTYPVSDTVNGVLNQIDFLILLVFTFELILKFFALGLPKNWWRFFLNGWNVFDFFVVAACYLPTSWTGGAVAVLRLLRLLRVLKLFKAVPQLQIIMSGLAQGMGSIVWIAVLLGLMFYLFGIMAIMFFRQNDPVHFGTLDLTFLTLFRASTFEDWTDIMFIAMYGCQRWSFGEFDMRCENNNPHGLWAAMFWLVFIVLSALIMLNLVIGSICSSMSDAQEAFEYEKNRRDEISKVVASTKAKGKAYGLLGINHAVVEAWMDAFSRFDSNTNALTMEASILQEDLDNVLEMIGETGVLSSKSRELIKIRANHTIPIGMIDLMNFVECVAEDLMKQRIRGLASTTGMIVVQSCAGLDLNEFIADPDKVTFDPYVKLYMNEHFLGQTHTLSHTGPNPEWNERVTYAPEHCQEDVNAFRMEVWDDTPGDEDDLIGMVTHAVKLEELGRDFIPFELEPNPKVTTERTQKVMSEEYGGKPTLMLRFLPPAKLLNKKQVSKLQKAAKIAALLATDDVPFHKHPDFVAGKLTAEDVVNETGLAGHEAAPVLPVPGMVPRMPTYIHTESGPPTAHMLHGDDPRFQKGKTEADAPAPAQRPADEV